MMEQKKTGRRIVSKGAYAKVQSKKAWAVTQAAGVILGAITVLGFLLYHSNLDSAVSGPIAYIITGAALSFAGRQVRIIRAIEPVAPLTRANTAKLPVPESLVRASSEPRQAQEAVLLRAANEAQERHEEQLLRPAEGEAQQCYVVVVKELDVCGENSQPFFEMLAKTQNYSDRQINNLFTWALHVPFMEPPDLRIPAGSQEMAETLAYSCEVMGGICTIQPVIKEAYEWLYEGIGGQKQV